jgi:hypothetical protein
MAMDTGRTFGRTMQIDPLAIKFALAPFAVFAIIMGIFVYLKNRK